MNRPDREVRFDYKGKVHVGSYTVQGQLLTVYYCMESKSDLLSGTSPEALAALLLSELVVEKEKNS